MYFSHTVKIPEDHIVRMRNKDTVYVYWEMSRTYIGEKRYTAPKRVCIGKEDPSSPGFMHPNDNFMLYFPEEGMPEKEKKELQMKELMREIEKSGKSIEEVIHFIRS